VLKGLIDKNRGFVHAQGIGINDDSGRADPFNARLLDRNLIEGVENAIASKGAGAYNPAASACIATGSTNDGRHSLPTDNGYG